MKPVSLVLIVKRSIKIIPFPSEIQNLRQTEGYHKGLYDHRSANVENPEMEKLPFITIISFGYHDRHIFSKECVDGNRFVGI